jgi:hypothetical protein
MAHGLRRASPSGIAGPTGGGRLGEVRSLHRDIDELKALLHGKDTQDAHANG